MSDLLDPRQVALKAWVATLAGVDPTCVQWVNEPRVQTMGTNVLLSWLGDVPTGTADLRFDVDPDVAPPDSNATPLVVTTSVVSLQLGFETFDQRATAPNARALAMRVRDRLRLPSSRAALKAANLALVDSQPVTQADYRAQQHMVSRAILEVRFNASNVERDTGVGGPTTTMESLDVTSHVADVDGTALPASLQMTAVDIPDAEGGP